MSIPTVLVVDDNEDILDFIDEVLADHEFRVIRARSGPEAMSRLLSDRIDVLLLDLAMPDMNGFAVLEMVRFIPRLMNTTVIIQTAHGGAHNLARAKELGARAVLRKPISREELLQEVQNCLATC